MSSTSIILGAVVLVVVVLALGVRSRLKIKNLLNVNHQLGDPRAGEIGTSTIIIGTWVIVFAVVGFGVIFIWGYSQPESANQTAWSLFAVDAMIACASGAVGALLGFIFGIPRTLDPSTRVAVATASQAGSTAAGSQAALAANTNLERISDWLTTLLIGATLVQSEKVIGWIGGLGTKFQSVSEPLKNEHVVPLIVVYFFALAFLGIYLVTRLYLTFALQQTLALLTGVAISGLKITTTSLPDGVTGSNYAPTTLQVSGGTLPTTWSVSPALPAGLALDPASGTISGTPQAAAAKSNYTVTVTDSSAPPVATAAQLSLVVT